MIKEYYALFLPGINSLNKLHNHAKCKGSPLTNVHIIIVHDCRNVQ